MFCGEANLNKLEKLQERVLLFVSEIEPLHTMVW